MIMPRIFCKLFVKTLDFQFLNVNIYIKNFLAVLIDSKFNLIGKFHEI